MDNTREIALQRYANSYLKNTTKKIQKRKKKKKKESTAKH